MFVVCLLVYGLAVAFLCCMFDWFGVGVVCGFWVCCLFCLIVILIVYRVFGVGWLSLFGGLCVWFWVVVG